jgi:hypothetical protein
MMVENPQILGDLIRKVGSLGLFAIGMGGKPASRKLTNCWGRNADNALAHVKNQSTTRGFFLNETTRMGFQYYVPRIYRQTASLPIPG